MSILPVMMLSSNEQQQVNPLVSPWTTPYETPPFDQVKTEHYLPAFKLAIELARAEVNTIAKDQQAATFPNTIEALELSGRLLARVSSIFFNLNEAETNDTLQQIAEEVSPLLSDFSNDLYLNEQLFERVKTVHAQAASLTLNEEQKMLLEKTYRSFVRSGANLSATDKEVFRTVSKELNLLTLKFNQNVLAETNNYTLHVTKEGDMAGLPADIFEAAAQEAKERSLDGWVFTLQQPSLGPFLKYSENRGLREKLHMAFASRCAQDNEYNNTTNIQQVLTLRLKMANLLGFKTFAEYALLESMARNTGRVNDLLDELLVASMPFAIKELEEVQRFAQSLGANFQLMPWDFSFYSEKLKAKKYDLDDEMTRPYFQLDKVTDGVFKLANRLYGINFHHNPAVPVYHADVKAYDVTDVDGKLLSVLYLDFFPRAGKRGGAWMTEFRGQYKINGIDHRPLVSLVCNFSKPSASKPSLLTYNEVETYLHEFGHGLHGMLSDVQYESLSGTNVYRDFVELPSQIMENWGVEKEFLDMFAAHYETGEAIPAALIERITGSRNFMEGYLCVRQLNFGMIDMAYHTIERPFTEDVLAFEKIATEPTRLLPLVEGTSISAAFSHIFGGGYAAGYYSYKWSEKLDADAFAVFKKNGLFDKATAQSFRDNILSKGGTEHPMTLYVRFRGQEPCIDALLQRAGFVKEAVKAAVAIY